MIHPHAEYMALGSTSASRQAAYRALVDDGLTAEDIAAIRKSTGGNLPYGSESFVDRLETSSGRATRPKPRGRPPKRRPD